MGTAWNTYDANKMSSGAMYGKTLAELSLEIGEQYLNDNKLDFYKENYTLL